MKKMYYVLPTTRVVRDELIAEAVLKPFTVYNEAKEAAVEASKKYSAEFVVLETRAIINYEIVINDLDKIR